MDVSIAMIYAVFDLDLGHVQALRSPGKDLRNMIDPQRGWSILFVLVWCLTQSAGAGAGANAQPQGPAATQVLAKLLPLPDDVPRTIMNPYHAQPAWKLWALDPSPVTLDKPHFKGTFQIPDGVRKYPIFFRKGSDKVTLKPLQH